MIYAWIDEHRDEFPINEMVRVLRVSRSGFYAWKNRAPSQRSIRTAKVAQDVMEVHAQSREIYGIPKIVEVLNKSANRESACRATICKIMKENSIKSCVSRAFKPTTTVSDPTKQAAPNLLNQEFLADAPDKKWVADITYLKTDGGWVYLAVVLDLFSRKVVGWEISKSLDTELVLAAMNRAIKSREPEPEPGKLLHHSDRGCQYTSERFQRRLKAMDITCSMSRVGCCYDNAVMERFFWSLKKEWTNHHRYENLESIRKSVFWYIEIFYNTERIHQNLNYKTPVEMETEYHLNAAL